MFFFRSRYDIYEEIISVIWDPEFLTSFILLQVTWTKPELALTLSKFEQAAVMDFSVTCIWHIKVKGVSLWDHMGDWQTPLFACISCILCGLNWFPFRIEKRSWKTAKRMKKCHKYIFSSSKSNCIFYQMTTSVMFLPLSLSYMLSLSRYSLVLALSLFVSHSLTLSVTR